MRAMAVVAVLALAGCGGAAESEPADDRAREWESICKSVSDIAMTAMTGRQQGALMSDMMDAASNNPEIGGIARSLVERAFSEPRYSTEAMQQKQITDFTNQAYLECLAASK